MEFLEIEDFRNPVPVKGVDICVSNPPYSLAIRSYEYSILQMEFDLSGHNLRYWDWILFLRFVEATKIKRGRVAVLMSLGAMNRMYGEKEIRKSILTRGGLVGIIALPSRLFTKSNVAPVVVIFDHKYDGKLIRFVDASNEIQLLGQKRGERKKLDSESVLDLFSGSADFENEKACYASWDEISRNDFSFSPFDYVGPISNDPKKSLGELTETLHHVQEELKATRMVQLEILKSLDVSPFLDWELLFSE
jgi:type I restriction-modification system DNA methylase subunit